DVKTQSVVVEVPEIAPLEQRSTVGRRLLIVQRRPPIRAEDRLAPVQQFLVEQLRTQCLAFPAAKRIHVLSAQHIKGPRLAAQCWQLDNIPLVALTVLHLVNQTARQIVFVPARHDEYNFAALPHTSKER